MKKVYEKPKATFVKLQVEERLLACAKRAPPRCTKAASKSS